MTTGMLRSWECIMQFHPLSDRYKTFQKIQSIQIHSQHELESALLLILFLVQNEEVKQLYILFIYVCENVFL